MLIGLAIFLFLIALMLGIFLRYAADEINRLETQITSVSADADDWCKAYMAAVRRNNLAADALRGIVDMSTPGMANIGSRMATVASTGLLAMYPTVKPIKE